MDTHYPTIDEPATAEYVLAVFQDEHRQQCRYDDQADQGADVELELVGYFLASRCRAASASSVIRWPGAP